MPIYFLLDGIVLFGGTEFGFPVATFEEGVQAVPDAIGQFKPINLTFAYTSGLPYLMKEVSTPRPIAGGVITFTDLNNIGQETPFMRLVLTNVVISKIEFSGGSTGKPFVAMDLAWQTMQAQTIGPGGITENYQF